MNIECPMVNVEVKTETFYCRGFYFDIRYSKFNIQYLEQRYSPRTRKCFASGKFIDPLFFLQLL